MCNSSENRHIILYAEDDIDDLEAVKECFSQSKENIEVLHAFDGQQALFLLEMLETSHMLPCLIILDINMPIMDGKQVLVKIKQSPTFKSVPVVLFTTSDSSLDKEFARKWGADFITKPIKLSEIQGMVNDFANRCKLEHVHKLA